MTGEHGAETGSHTAGATATADGPLGPEERRQRRRGRMFGAMSGVSAAVFAVTFIGLTLWSPDGSVDRVSLSGTGLAPNAFAIAVFTGSGSGVSVTLDAEGLDPAPEGAYYQAWMIGDEGAVSIGTFHARETGNGITLWSGVDLVSHPRLTITLQREGGGAEPSDQVVLRGTWDR